MTKREILDETVEYYTHNPRALVAVTTDASTTCCYLTEDGKMCAVGRCLDENKVPRERRLNNCNSLLAEGSFFLNGLKDEYLGHSMEFWEDLQELHDEDDHWSADVFGLTPYGKVAYQNLLYKHKSQ